jgi:hypothetical protein
MALQAFRHGMVWPMPPLGPATNPNYGSAQLLIDAADEAAGMVVRAPKSGTISKIHWSTITVATGATLDVRLETVDATTGFPSGSLWSANTNGAQIVANADDNTGFATPLTAGAVVTKGDALGVVIKNPGASFGNIQVANYPDDFSKIEPYCCLYTGSWAMVTTTGPMVALEYDDGSFEHILGTFYTAGATATATTLSTSTTPDVVGARFQLTFPDTVRGGWFWADFDGDCVIKLVSDDYHQANDTATLKAVASLDKDLRNATGAGIRWVEFTTSVDLLANTWYRYIIEPTTTTALTTYDTPLPSLAALDSYAGQNFHYTTAKDPTADGSWTNYNSGTFRIPFCGLVFSAFSDGAGSGGGGVIMTYS